MHVHLVKVELESNGKYSNMPITWALYLATFADAGKKLLGNKNKESSLVLMQEPHEYSFKKTENKTCIHLISVVRYVGKTCCRDRYYLSADTWYVSPFYNNWLFIFLVIYKCVIFASCRRVCHRLILTITTYVHQPSIFVADTRKEYRYLFAYMFVAFYL